MVNYGVNDELSLETKGTTNQKVIVAILLLIPMVVFAATPIYNFNGPQLLGLSFYYWFETLWLVISAIFYLGAAYMLNKMESGKA
ncbi:MAG: DUF3311 domain-containing protein [Candidatus Thermoplasmatota archaeon]|jgi:TRAP-type mannitol/chloroaromatic compound transport system permease small subunit|nr:DUF3311 domain-containing protein [Candidatus Thermoplasmatota archaeon]